MTSLLKLIIFIAALTTLSAALAQADNPACSILKDCNEPKAKVEAWIQEHLIATPPNLGDFERDSEGRVLKMSQDNAESRCANHGLKLPTARELALYSQSLGALGVCETAYPGRRVDPDSSVWTEIRKMGEDGYYPIYAKNASGGLVVDFYFSARGYKRPQGDRGDYWFWSSTAHPYDDRYVGYVFHGFGGDIGYLHAANYGNGAVRCAR